MDIEIESLTQEELDQLAGVLLPQYEAAQAAGEDYSELEGAVYRLQERQRALDKQAADERQARVAALGHALLSDLRLRKGERAMVELRWLADNARYNSEYQADKLKELTERAYGSKAFVPLTRRVINVVEARLGDLLFPADDLNFGVQHSPSPELPRAAELAAQLPEDADVGGGLQAGPVRTAVAELIDQARSAAAAMQREVQDQLAESDYASEARLAIRDGLVMGIGVIKGPTLYLRTRKQWTVNEDGTSTLEVVEDERPSSARVDPWLFFPETAAKSMKGCGSTFEGHPMSRTELAQLARMAGFDKDAIRAELQGLPNYTPDANEQAAKEASGTAQAQRNKYMVWEYQGPIDAKDLEACGCKVPDDPLLTYSGVVFFTDSGRVIKAIINPMATGALPYHVWSWQPDANSIYGYGLAYELRDMQDAANSSWRAGQDNMGLSVGGMLVADPKQVQPYNKRWAIEPNKIFLKTEPGGRLEDAIKYIEIPSRIQELLTVFKTASQMCDEIGGPMLAMQGQDAPSYMETAQGMSIAYNAASVWMRRAVKNWDDFITVPQIGQYIDWNMEHNPKKEIKGDLRPIARGSSHLLEAEGQAQRIQLLIQASQAMGIPIRKAVNQLRTMCRAMRLDPDELLPSDDEVLQMEEAQKNAQPQLTPEQERLQIRQMELEDRKADREHQAELTRQTNELRWAELASKEGLTREQVQAKYAADALKTEANLIDRREQRTHEAQSLNAELASRMTTGAGV